MIDVHDDLVAALAGRYEIERELGHGGMATVYLARDVRHDRHVALKVLRADLTSSLGAERFVREINIAARLSHPHILALYDSGAAGNTLYYVMPHVAGETLRQRLDREHQLPLDEAMAITRQIASALDYAHAQGVVHRDIKPENVLLLDDHVLVADFGLARALYSAASTRLTGSAVAVGTPAYMSPEQAAADPQVDGRTDLYSLACVLFEMVTGSPPFHGATVQALMMHHINSPPPSICAQRTACPAWVDEAVQRALAKMPADRFRTAAQFVRALEQQSPGSTPVGGGPPVPTATGRFSDTSRQRTMMLGAAVLVAISLAMFLGRRSTRPAPASEPLDPSRYHVATFTPRGSSSATVAAVVSERVNDALAEWRGINVWADAVAPSDTTAPGRNRDALLRAALQAAASRGTRWLLWGDVAVDGDTVTVRAVLHDARSGAPVRQDMIRHATVGAAPRALYRQLVSNVLRSRRELPWLTPGDPWTPSLPAWQAYDRGRDAIARWDLAEASRELNRAIAADPDHAQAQLWLAQLGKWTLQPLGGWMTAARRSHALRSRLAPADAAVAEGQLHIGEGRYPSACAAFKQVIQHDSTDFRGWLGMGDCQARDSVVVPSQDSPSGHRFRSSFQNAALAYTRARNQMQAPRPGFIYERLGRVLFTEAFRFRPGRTVGARATTFASFPALAEDTISFTPYPIATVMAARPEASPLTQSDALQNNRRILRPLYVEWVAESPHSIEAHASLSKLLELNEELVGAEDGRLSALGEIAAARRLIGGGERRFEFGRTQVRILTKAARWAAASTLADSLLAASDTIRPQDAAYVAGVAALTGRLEETRRLLMLSDTSSRITLSPGRTTELPPTVDQAVLRILPEVALGVCGAHLDAFPRELEQRLESYYPDKARRRGIRDAILRRVLIFAVPCGQLAGLEDVQARDDPWLRMQRSLARRDPAGVRREFAGLQQARRGIRPGDASVDMTFVEAWMLVQAGDTATAIAHLDHTLRALPTLGPILIDSPTQAAGLVRAMALRAELAASLGDRATARYWSDAVSTLWRTSDPPLRPLADRMRTLTSAN